MYIHIYTHVYQNRDIHDITLGFFSNATISKALNFLKTFPRKYLPAIHLTVDYL
jgi:hypothetical protein